MKRLLYALSVILFTLGVLSTTGCAGDLTDYGKNGGAMQSYQWYEEVPRNKAAPDIINDTDAHWWLIGECSATAPGDSWAFSKAGDGPNAGKWVLTFKPKRFNNWGQGGKEGDGDGQLTFCIAGKINKADVSDWDKVNGKSGSCRRYALAAAGGNSGAVPVGTIVKLVEVTDSNTNFSISGLTLKEPKDEADSAEYTCVLDDSALLPSFVMVAGGADKAIDTVVPPDTYLGIQFQGKPYQALVENGKALITVPSTGTAANLYITWKSENYTPKVAFDVTDPTKQEQELQKTADNTPTEVSVTVENAEKYKIQLDILTKNHPKLKIWKVESLYKAEGINGIKSNAGDIVIADGDWVTGNPTNPDPYTFFCVKTIASGATPSVWGNPAEPDVFQFGIVKDNWTTKFVGVKPVVNGAMVDCQKGASDNNKVEKMIKTGEATTKQITIVIKSTETAISTRVLYQDADTDTKITGVPNWWDTNNCVPLVLCDNTTTKKWVTATYVAAGTTNNGKEAVLHYACPAGYNKATLYRFNPAKFDKPLNEIPTDTPGLDALNADSSNKGWWNKSAEITITSNTGAYAEQP